MEIEPNKFITFKKMSLALRVDVFVVTLWKQSLSKIKQINVLMFNPHQGAQNMHLNT